MAALRGKRLVVVGCGVGGLSYVHYLRNFLAASNKSHLIDRIVLLESNDYMGGSIKTNVFDDNLVHEMGPRSVRSVGIRAKNTVTLLEQLGLGDKLVMVDKTTKKSNERYIYNGGKLNKVEMTFAKFFSKIPGADRSMFKAILKDRSTPKLDLSQYPNEDPSVYQFFAHRFGEDVAEAVIDPLLRGVTAGDARRLSAKAMFGDMVEREQHFGKLIGFFGNTPVPRAKVDDLFPNDIMKSKLLDKFDKLAVSSWNLTSGLQTLPERLSATLVNTNTDGKVEIYNRSTVESMELQDPNLDKESSPCRIHVKTLDGDTVKLEADHIVAAIPSVQLAKILPEAHMSALKEVCSIDHVPVGCVTIEYRNLQNQPDIIKSFGFLTHSKAGCKVLGIAFDSGMFPRIDAPYQSTRMTCMIGGEWFEDMTGTSDVNRVDSTKLEQIALDEVRRILGIQASPHRMSSILWKTGIAQYRPGHKDMLKQSRQTIESLRLPITLLGQSYDGVAVNEVIFSARQAASSYVNSL